MLYNEAPSTGGRMEGMTEGGRITNRWLTKSVFFSLSGWSTSFGSSKSIRDGWIEALLVCVVSKSKSKGEATNNQRQAPAANNLLCMHSCRISSRRRPNDRSRQKEFPERTFSYRCVHVDNGISSKRREVDHRISKSSVGHELSKATIR